MNILSIIKNFYTLIIATAGKSRAIIIVTIVVTIIGLGSVYFLKADNPVEQAVEEVIKTIDGVTIDLTPGS